MRLALCGWRDGRVEREPPVDLQYLPANDVRPHVQVVCTGRKCETHEAQHGGTLSIQIGRERKVAVVPDHGAFEYLDEPFVRRRPGHDDGVALHGEDRRVVRSVEDGDDHGLAQFACATHGRVGCSPVFDGEEELASFDSIDREPERP